MNNIDILKNICRIVNQPRFSAHDKVNIVNACDDFLRPFCSTDGKESQQKKPHCVPEIKTILATLFICEINDFGESQFLCLLKVLKVLFQLSDNRDSMTEKEIKMILSIFGKFLKLRRLPCTVECCNIVLNLCYTKLNCLHIVNNNGVTLLIHCIFWKNIELNISAMGALQAISYIPQGRSHVTREREVLAKIAEYCLSDNTSSSTENIQTRAIGLIHNLSVDVSSIILLTELGFIDIILQLLIIFPYDEEIAPLALGTLQNLSRDPSVRDIISAKDGLTIIVHHLMSPYVPCQIAALSILMNLKEGITTEETKSFLADVIALGAISSALFDS